MPIYDYRCTECGTVVEVMHRIDGSGPETCAACGGPMRKALSTPAIHFKGSGWAKKDAAAASAKKAKPKAATSPASGSSSDGEAKADSASSGTSDEPKGDSDRASSKGSADSSGTKSGKAG